MALRIFDWIFPPRCPFCRQFLNRGPVAVCPQCQEDLDWMEEDDKRHRPPLTDGCVGVLPYEGMVRQAIHRYKYRGSRGLSRVFGQLLAQRLRSSGVAEKVQAVCWVPCHAATRRKRGYDQAEVLARQVAGELGLPAACLLRKARKTKPMNKLGLAERRANVLGAFVPLGQPGQLAGARLLLVDDVYTTGATLSECARVLREQGAEKIYGATLARTLSQKENQKKQKNLA